ncbi:MAG TPA: TonB-dependent receptor [Candidatus Acidoferrales bacterium]|nr:TonB-dependent receptor [Candidatus Acidoferrales bacterium]
MKTVAAANTEVVVHKEEIMSRSFSRSLILSLLAGFMILATLAAPPVWAQMGSQGTVNVTVLDQSGGAIAKAQLTLVDISTNAVRTGATLGSGTYSFTGLSIGTYQLTVSKDNFQTQVFDSVVVQAGQVTDVKASLKIGAASERVVVTATASPLLQTSSNAIGTTIDMKEIEDLPLQGRDISSLSQLAPGFSHSTADGGGTWNGLPEIAQGNNVDGVISSTNRMKFSGDTAPEVSARIEDMQEMTVQTSNLDLNQGFGQSAMQANFVTRRGSNNYHGRVYEDFQNAALNANSWTNDALGRRKNHLILNNFGGAVGGPILKNKLFFFGSFSESKQPGGFTAQNSTLTATAASGLFTYRDGPNAGQTVNLFTQVAAPNGLPTTVNSMVASEISTVIGAEKYGTVSAEANPNLSLVTWAQNAPRTNYYPTFRVDYDLSPKFRINVAWNRTYEVDPNAAQTPFPGPTFAAYGASNKFNYYTSSLGFDWTVTPTMVNEFRGGYFYNFEDYSYDAQPSLYTKNPFVNWAIGNDVGPCYCSSGQSYNLGINDWYPIFNFADNVTWQHGSHTITYGVSWWREQDHYSDAPNALESFSLGLVQGDPALADFNSYFSGASNYDRAQAENLYATLVGRISSVGPNGPGFSYNPKTGQYNTAPNYSGIQLNELQKAWGLYFQDAYRIKPSLTLNYGLRWDFTGDDFDLNHQYQSATPNGIFGPSGINNLFKPGSLSTNPADLNPQYIARSHQYNPWNVSPQPTIGLAWNPNYTEGWLGRLMGGGKTVIRAGFQLRRFTEPEQYVWNDMSNHGFGYYQNYSLQAVSGGGTGTFAPGTLALGDTLPPFLLTPPSYSPVIPESIATWVNYWGAGGIDPHIRQPYTQQWNLGIQRQIGENNVLEIRYLGSRSVHEWINQDPNEVNIFENGFLNEFQNAQTNLANNATSGDAYQGTFAYDPSVSGDVPLPIFDAAFAGEATIAGGPFVDYGSNNFIIPLQQGAAGGVAGMLAMPFGTVPYACNLLGSAVPNCANGTYASMTSPGPYPVNFFVANALGEGSGGPGTNYMTDGGYGNYNGLQIDFRQHDWHGMQFDVNYTWSHSLGQQPDNQWLGSTNQFTMRNLRLSYGPTLFDIRQVVHASGSYDLPFGNGRRFLNRSGAVGKIVGGWNVGTIVTYQTGSPFVLFGGYNTFNDYADGGIVLSGVSVSQLQSAVGVYHVPGHTYADGLNPKYLAGTAGGGNSTFINPNSTPGVFAAHPWLYGPHFFNTDLAVTKSIPIYENVRFVFQSEFLNAFNHPNWTIHDYYPYDNIQANFGLANVINTTQVHARTIEFRANIEF